MKSPGRDQTSPPLAALGKVVSDTSDATADPSVIAAARSRWLANPAKPVKSRGGWTLIAAAAALMIGFSVFWLAQPTEPMNAPLTFVLAPGDSPGVIGDWVAAGHDEAVGLHFSDDTVVTAKPGARVRVADSTANGAEVALERGEIHARVVHRNDDSKWTVRAGPFGVIVTGTEFNMGWDPANEVFDLKMTEGSVLVTGPHIPQDRRLVAGERLRVSIADGTMELATANSAPSINPEPAPSEPTSLAVTAAKPVASAPTAPDWRGLIKKGDHAGAMRLVEERGFEAEIATASSSELLSLANAARFSGAPGRARQALIAHRQRFGGGQSTFLLGKIAADQLAAPGEAVQWFETYLGEQPNGPLAEQALGRILEIRRGSNSAAARDTAQRYLNRYPNGAHSKVAKSILEP